MRYTSTILSAAALVSVAIAGDAPVVTTNDLSTTYSATIPQKNSTQLSGAIKVAGSPDGQGVQVQVALYNLPDSGDLSYGIYSGQVTSVNDCSAAGSYFNPYGGITGDKCSSDKASCAVGDLSDKYGDAKVLSGGSGTGYFSANYQDKYMSTTKGDEAFIGDGSFVVTDSSGGYVACANFVNPEKGAAKQSKSAAKHATKTPSAASASSASSSASATSNSDNAAGRTGGSAIAAGVVGIAALLL